MLRVPLTLRVAFLLRCYAPGEGPETRRTGALRNTFLGPQFDPRRLGPSKLAPAHGLRDDIGRKFN